MALDEALLEGVCANEAPSTLRLYFWQQPAITVGRFQNVQRTLNLVQTLERDLPIVRRITGGRGILHGPDITIGIATSLESLGLTSDASVITIYQRLAGIYLRAFRILGIPAVMGACASQGQRDVRGNCFAVASRADIIDSDTGNKLLGAAIFRRGRFVLQQASLPYQHRDQYRVFADTLFQGGSDTLNSDIFTEPTQVELCDAIRQGFEEEITRSILVQLPTTRERDRTTKAMQRRYLDPEWNAFPMSASSPFEIDSVTQL